MLQNVQLRESSMSIPERNAMLLNNAIKENNWHVAITGAGEATNLVGLVGIITKPFTYLYSFGDEHFYKGFISSARKSGAVDELPLIVSNRTVSEDFLANCIYERVEISGEYRSRNVIDEDGKGHLKLFIFAKTMKIVEDDESNEENLLFLHGNICKQPIIRTTPFGKVITDFLLAVNRRSVKSDYIPCIAWGRTAEYIAKKCEVGDEIKIFARMMSRDYNKQLTEGECETRTAYEASVFLIKHIPINNRKQIELVDEE